MLKHLLKVMARDYVTYILIFLIISTGLYTYYIVDASYMAADAVVEHYILDYKPHFTIKFIPAIKSPFNYDNPNTSIWINELKRINQSIYNIVDRYPELEVSIIYMAYSFTIGRYSFEIYFGDLESLKGFGFIIDDLDHDKETIYVLNGDFDTSVNILNDFLDRLEWDFVEVPYISIKGNPLFATDEPVDINVLYIVVDKLDDIFSNRFLNEVIGKIFEDPKLYNLLINFDAYISINYIDLESLEQYMDRPRDIIDIVVDRVNKYLSDVSKDIDYQYDLLYNSLKSVEEGGQETFIYTRGDMIYIRNDILRILLSMGGLVVNFITGNASIFILLYIPIGIFLIHALRRIRNLFYHDVYKNLIIRGFHGKNIELYILTALTIILFISVITTNLILHYIFSIGSTYIIYITLSTMASFIISYILIGYVGTPTRKISSLLTILTILFILAGSIRLNPLLLYYGFSFLLIPMAFIYSLSPIYALFLPFILYQLFIYFISILESRFTRYIYMFRSLKSVNIVIYSGLYTLSILIFIIQSPFEYIYEVMIQDKRYTSAIGFDKISEINILDIFMDLHYPLILVISVSTLTISIFLVSKDSYNLIKYSRLRGLDRGYINRILSISTLITILYTTMFTFISFLIITIYLDAQIGINYSAFKAKIEYDPDTGLPRLSIKDIYQVRHLWEVIIRWFMEILSL